VNLALFDLDNTLLNGDSDFEWSQFLIRIGVLDRELFEAKNLAFYEHYKAGTLDIDASDKAARFIRFCNAFNIPSSFLSSSGSGSSSSFFLENRSLMCFIKLIESYQNQATS